MELTQDFKIPTGTDLVRQATSTFWSDVRWRTLHCLIEHKGHLPISELARQTGISVDEAVRALEAMEFLNLVRRTTRGYEQTQAFVRRDLPHHADQVEKATACLVATQQITNRILEGAFTNQAYTRRLVYNSNHHLAKELAENIQKAIDDFKKKSDEGRASWDGVYALSTAITAMTTL